MASYTQEKHKFNGNSSGERVLEINVMRESYAEDRYWDRTYQYVVDMLDAVYNHSDYSIPGTIARKYDTDAVIGCNSLFDDGNDWLDEAKLDNGDGIYLWVVGACDNTHIAVAAGSGAWTNRRQGFIGDSSYPNEHEVAFSGVHEGLHPYVLAGPCDEINNEVLNGDQVSDGDGGQEYSDHELGDIQYDSNKGFVGTTMLGHYGQDIAENGDCDYWTDRDGFVNDLTTCTHKAIKLSREHAGDEH